MSLSCKVVSALYIHVYKSHSAGFRYAQYLMLKDWYLLEYNEQMPT